MQQEKVAATCVPGLEKGYVDPEAVSVSLPTTPYNTPKSTTGRFIVMQHRTVNNLRLQLQHTETQRDMANIERDYYCRELVALHSMYDNMKRTHMSVTNNLESKLKRADINQDALQLLCVDFKRECATLKSERDEAVIELESTEDA
jgi:hypothetical protein